MSNSLTSAIFRFSVFPVEILNPLSQKLFEQLHANFPDIELASVTESYENPYDTWVNIVMPEDKERELTLRDLAVELSTDTLLNYGYSITISAEPRRAMVAV